MTRKHFQAFGDAIKAREDQLAGHFGPSNDERLNIIHEMINLVCAVAREDNPKFKRETFVKACGWEEMLDRANKNI
jgi:hypothetical protein